MIIVSSGRGFMMRCQFPDAFERLCEKNCQKEQKLPLLQAGGGQRCL
jgi:hypothetical protein